MEQQVRFGISLVLVLTWMSSNVLVSSKRKGQIPHTLLFLFLKASSNGNPQQPEVGPIVEYCSRFD
jgi:hypothetical protein